MKKGIKILFMLVSVNLVNFCHKKTENSESIVTGSTKIVVDETIKSIIEDEKVIFETAYKAKIILNSKSENEVLNDLIKGYTKIAIITNKLSKKDSLYFVINMKIKPIQTPFATDALVFISNKKNNDTLISLNNIHEILNGVPNSKIKGLVFDNLNSSVFNYMFKWAGLKSIPKTGIYSFNNSTEVIKYVSENIGMIGIVNLNSIFNTTKTIESYKQNINILSVKNINSNDYFYPSQYNIGEGKYPLIRNLYIINCQGYSGLGMGFASFIRGERGQRIILKSGLLPWKIPTRLFRNIKKN